MNITGRPPYKKGGIKKKSNTPTQSDRKHWALALEVGCIVRGIGCGGRITIHHCFTGAGGRKDHKKVIPLCMEHHVGADGIDGRVMSKKKWQMKYGSEELLLLRLEDKLKERRN